MPPSSPATPAAPCWTGEPYQPVPVATHLSTAALLAVSEHREDYPGVAIETVSLPRYQRQGVGRDMFAELETCFPDATAMLLEVDPRNDAAVAFYRVHGFVKVGETKHSADDVSGVPLHVYEKPLEG